MPASREVPEWVEHALNGVSTRAPRTWSPKPGDVIAGEVVEIGEGSRGKQHGRFTILTVRVSTASLEGETVEAGEWLRLECVPAVLRRWVERDAPQVGDKIAVQLRSGKGWQLDYVAGIGERATPEGW